MKNFETEVWKCLSEKEENSVGRKCTALLYIPEPEKSDLLKKVI